MEFPKQENVLINDYELAETLLINNLKNSKNMYFDILYNLDIGKFISFDNYRISLSLLKEIFNNNDIYSIIKKNGINQYVAVLRFKDSKLSDEFVYFTPQYLVDVVDILNE